MQSFRTIQVLIFLAVTAATQILFNSYLPEALYLDLPLVVVLCIGWHSPPVKAATCGIVFGLMQDTISGIALGFNGLSKTILGFGASYLGSWITLEGISSRLLLIGLLSLLDGAIVYSMFHILQQPSTHTLWPDAVITVPVTAIGGELFFRTYDRIKSPPKDFRHIEDSR